VAGPAGARLAVAVAAGRIGAVGRRQAGGRHTDVAVAVGLGGLAGEIAVGAIGIGAGVAVVAVERELLRAAGRCQERERQEEGGAPHQRPPSTNSAPPSAGAIDAVVSAARASRASN